MQSLIRFFATVAFAILPHLAFSEDAPAHPVKPLLWKIEGKGLSKPSYLFGTIHLGSGPLAKLHPAAEAAFEAITAGRSSDELTSYQAAYDKSWVAKELRVVRNTKPLLARCGTVLGGMLLGDASAFATLTHYARTGEAIPGKLAGSSTLRITWNRFAPRV